MRHACEINYLGNLIYSKQFETSQEARIKVNAFCEKFRADRIIVRSLKDHGYVTATACTRLKLGVVRVRKNHPEFDNIDIWYKDIRLAVRKPKKVTPEQAVMNKANLDMINAVLNKYGQHKATWEQI